MMPYGFLVEFPVPDHFQSSEYIPTVYVLKKRSGKSESSI